MMNILLVEDDLVNQKIASQFLITWGMRVTPAQDGDEAVALVTSRQFDLILMDLNLPGIDGFDTTREIRQMQGEYFQNVPILAFTASNLTDTKAKAQQHGMNDVVGKPLNPVEMHCKINEYALNGKVDKRPMRIRFELFTDGTPNFKAELLGLMIKNVRELQYAGYQAFYAGEITGYAKACHKLKSTVMLLDDNEFSFTVEGLKTAFESKAPKGVLQEKIIRLNILAESIIKSLEEQTLVLTELSGKINPVPYS